MIVTDNEVWAHKAKYLTTQAKDDPVEYRLFQSPFGLFISQEYQVMIDLMTFARSLTK